MDDMSIDRNHEVDTTRQLVGHTYDWLGKPVSRGWLLLAVSAFAASCLGWWLRLRPTVPVWGPVSEWVGGLGQLAAVIFLAWQIALLRSDQAARTRSEEEAVRAEREGRAKAVAVTASLAASGRVLCFAVNGGLFPIYGVALQCGTISAQRTFTTYGELKQVSSGGVLLPAAVPARIEFDAPRESPGVLLGVVMDFGDAWGYHWRRIVSLDGSINELLDVSDEAPTGV